MVSADRFRSRASEYYAEATATVDAEKKAALLALAQRWSRLASELDGTSEHQDREQNMEMVKAG